jgi:hypothetical protein
VTDQNGIGERSSTRRALLAASIGGVGAWVAGALGRAAPVAAANGDVVNVGDNLTGTATTVFNVSTANFSALWGNSTAGSGTGVGVRGDTASTGSGAAGVLGNGGRVGVLGNGSDAGVLGRGGTGVRGEGATGVEGVGDAIGAYGFSADGYGVRGNTDAGPAAVSGAAGGTAAGVEGVSYNHGTGVYGISNGQPVAAVLKAKTGVYGQALQDSGSRGVWGKSSAGQGVRGEVATGSGVYGIATSQTGYAIRGSGKLRFDKVSGVATIPAGATSVTITPGVDINSSSFVLLTSKTNLSSRSLYYSTDSTNNRFTIRLSSSRTSSTVVAWLLVG